MLEIEIIDLDFFTRKSLPAKEKNDSSSSKSKCLNCLSIADLKEEIISLTILQ